MTAGARNILWLDFARDRQSKDGWMRHGRPAVVGFISGRLAGAGARCGPVVGNGVLGPVSWQRVFRI